MINYYAKAFSEAGRGKANQDAFLIKNIDNGAMVIAIADGMGGKSGGEIASNLAINTISQEVDLSNLYVPLLFQRVKEALIDKAKQSPELSEMGTTLTVAIIQGNEVTVGHVGDTRLYHLRSNGIVAKTKDQTEVQKLLDDGILSKSRAKNYHRRNVLLSVLTPNRDFELQTFVFNIINNDRLLFLSDGAYSLISKIELRDILLKSKDLEHYLSQIKSDIESKKIHDDYSVVAFQAID